jgi:general stress protein 26
MDSINKNQPEDNRDDLMGSEAAEKIRAIVKDASSCFFCTALNSGHVPTRPMSVQRVDDDGTIWFLSASDSHKNKEIAENPEVQLYFQGSAHSDFLELYGNASVVRDRSIIHQLWGPLLKTWFTEGKDDPRITALKFEPTEGYYWDNKHGNAIAGVKIIWQNTG